MNADKHLIEFCESNKFPIDDMDEHDFQCVENSFEFQSFKLNRLFHELFMVISETIGITKFLDKMVRTINSKLIKQKGDDTINLIELFVLSCIYGSLIFIIGNTFVGVWDSYDGLSDVMIECIKYILTIYVGLVLGWSLQYIIPFIKDIM